jgi:hypothetical protein
MSLRRAIVVLPDDRETVLAIREIVAFFDRHRGEFVGASLVARATGVSDRRVDLVLGALSAAHVVDCDRDSSATGFTYVPDGVLELEVRRFLRQSDSVGSGLRRKTDRFRGRFGQGA